MKMIRKDKNVKKKILRRRLSEDRPRFVRLLRPCFGVLIYSNQENGRWKIGKRSENSRGGE